MCMKSSKPPEPVTPAAAPPAALPAPEPPSVGESRRAESRNRFGSDTPDYRVDRKTTRDGGSINPNDPITM